MFQYETEDRGAFGRAVITAVIAGSVAAVIVSIIALLVAGIFLSGCGGGSGSGDGPVYDENGQCIKNCSPDECPSCGYLDNAGNCVTGECAGDASVMPPEDTCAGCDTGGPKPDYIAPPCKVPTDPKIKKMCMPYWAQVSKCLSTWDYDILCGSPEDGLDGKDCYCYGEKAYDPETNGAKSCDTVADCQPIACEDWPPEVCWGLPCLLVGKWDCGEDSLRDWTDAEFYDNGDGYCRIHSPTSGDYYFKPGDDHFQDPPSGPFKEKATMLDGGSQFLEELADGYSYTCTKVVEEE